MAMAFAFGVCALPASANAVTLYDSNVQNFNSEFFASMNFNTSATKQNQGQTYNQQGGTSTGGAYAHGPYGAYGVAANKLVHEWTIIANATTNQGCSIGIPSGFTCSTSSGSVVFRKTSDFGSSNPTSTSLPAKLYTISSSGTWNYLQFDSSWTVRKNINGTVVERVVGNSTRHSS